MNRFRPVADDKERENADEQIKSHGRMQRTRRPARNWLVKMPGTQSAIRSLQKTGFKIQEGTKSIDNDMAKASADNRSPPGRIANTIAQSIARRSSRNGSTVDVVDLCAERSDAFLVVLTPVMQENAQNNTGSSAMFR